MSDHSIGVSFRADLEWGQDPDFMWEVDVTATVLDGVACNIKVTRLNTLFVHHGTLQAYYVDTRQLNNDGAVQWLNQKLQTRSDWRSQLIQKALGASRGTVART